MTNTLRRALAFMTLALGLAGAGCGGHSSVTGPTATTPPPPSGGGPLGGLAGDYTLTATADNACADLPQELRSRTFPATVTLSTYSRSGESNFEIVIGGPRFLEGFDSKERFSLEVDHDFGIFHLGSASGQPAFVEQLSATAYFAIGGVARGSVKPSVSSFSASFDGYVEYCVMESPATLPVEGPLYRCAPEKAVAHTRCVSNNHRLNWDRR